MRKLEDLAYYRQRADQEREIAERSNDHPAATVHARLAEEYRRRVSDGFAEQQAPTQS